MCATIVSRIAANLCRWRRSDSAALPPRHSSRLLLSQPRNQPGPRVASAVNIFQPLRCFLPLQCESGKWGFIKSVQAVDVPVMVFARWKSITLPRLSSPCIWHVQITHTYACAAHARTHARAHACEQIMQSVDTLAKVTRAQILFVVCVFFSFCHKQPVMDWPSPF